MSVIDSHCHLDDERFVDDQQAVIERALAAGVEQILTIGTGDGPPDYDCAIRVAEKYECVWATVGVHPHAASQFDDQSAARLGELLRHAKVLALGEIGLDYHYDFSPREQQHRAFRDQLEVAKSAGKPIIIHTREAWDDTFAILEKYWAPAGLPGIMHCFSGGPEEADRCLKMGFYLSFAGILTYPKASNVHEAAKIVPPEKMLVETDAPYLAPIPFRGKRNEPAYVNHTAARLAELRGVSVEEINLQTSANFYRLFALSSLPRTRGNG